MPVKVEQINEYLFSDTEVQTSSLQFTGNADFVSKKFVSIFFLFTTLDKITKMY